MYWFCSYFSAYPLKTGNKYDRRPDKKISRNQFKRFLSTKCESLEEAVVCPLNFRSNINSHRAETFVICMRKSQRCACKTAYFIISRIKSVSECFEFVFHGCFPLRRKFFLYSSCKKEELGCGEKWSTTGKIIEQQINVRLNAIGLTLILYEFWAYHFTKLLLLHEKRNKRNRRSNLNWNSQECWNFILLNYPLPSSWTNFQQLWALFFRFKFKQFSKASHLQSTPVN